MAEEVSSSSLPFGRRGEDLSIIIPTYNCAAYLQETLSSLQAQDGISLEEAQILVVDDCSTKDDPQAVINEVWPARVAFFRQSENLGPCANFNACLAHAEREWIHILHGDDFVFPEAYKEFANCIAALPSAVAVFGRSVTVNETGKWVSLSRLLGPEWRGQLAYDPEMWSANAVAFPGVLLSKSAIELVGQFDCSFCHCQDWNLWWRIAKTGRVAYSNRCIAAYREFQGNHTSTLSKTGKHLDETLDQIDRLVASVVAENSNGSVDVDSLYEAAFDRALSQCRVLVGERESFEANFRIFKRFPRPFQKRPRKHFIRMLHVTEMLKRRISSRRSRS